MVKDNTNQYYTDLLKHLQTEYAGLQGGQVYKAIPPSFPYMYFKQIEGSGALPTLSNTEEGINFGCEIKFYSNKSASEVRNIANTARGYMVSAGFRCAYFSPVENVSDSSIQQFVARFTKLDT